MIVRVELRIRIEAVGVHCWACGDRALLRSIQPTDAGPSPVGVWAAAHQAPHLTCLFSSFNDGPVEAHRLRVPKLLR